MSGYRESAGDPVSLTATMSDLPGIAPLPIDGQMDVTLDLTVGAARRRRSRAGPTPRPRRSRRSRSRRSPARLISTGTQAEVKVTGFTFNFAELSVGADCTASDSLGKMVVGSQPPDDDGTDSGSGDGTSGGGTSSGGTLPKTGEPTSLPVIALWAGALLLLGTALLLLLPIARPKGEHV